MIVEDSGEDDNSCQGDAFFGEGGRFGLFTAGQLRDSCNFETSADPAIRYVTNVFW